MNSNRISLAAGLAAAIFAFILLSSPATCAQSLSVIYNFQNAPDGANPVAGVTFDSHGKLYGTTQRGGTDLNGTLFQLVPGSGGNWTEQVISDFEFTDNGGTPIAPVALDGVGNIYGTFACTFDCFGNHGGGIFEGVHSSGGNWTMLNLADYWAGVSNGECMDGACGVAFDPVGRLYATTSQYQSQYGNNGAALYLGRRSISGWYTILLYNFRGGNDGVGPSIWFSFGANDAIYSTTSSGGASNAGTVFQLQNRGGVQWSETQLYAFRGGSDGAFPYGGVIFDSAGNLYGTTSGGGAGYGTVFKLTHNSNGTWTESVLYPFQGGSDAAHPTGPLTFDAAGNLYGVAAGGAYGHGAIFKLVPSGGQWTESVAYSFTGGLDGDGPSGGAIFDSAGNLYGTTVHGGEYPTCSDSPYCGGVVYKFTP